MNHSVRIIGISAFLLLFFSSAVMQSVADTQHAPILITKVEQDQHAEMMKGMTPTEKAQYRNEQYEILRKKAASIGYEMPETPPWPVSEATLETVTEQSPDTDAAQAEATGNTIATPARNRSRARAVPAIDSRHQKQLEKYRLAAAEKRKAMHERLEKQRQSVQERIDKLIEQNAIKPAQEAPRPVPPPPVTRPYAPIPPMAPVYPPWYRARPYYPPGYY